MVQAGDSIPSIELLDGPETKVNLAQELASGKGVIIGVPAAFSQSPIIYDEPHRSKIIPKTQATNI